MIGQEFQIGANIYRTVKMSAMAQFDVARGLGALLAMMSGLRKENPDATDIQMGKAFCSVMGMLPSATAHDAVNQCLAGAQRKQQTGFAPLVGSAGVLAFQDIDLSEMLAVAWHVLDDSGLVSFFDESLSASSGAEGLKGTMQ